MRRLVYSFFGSSGVLPGFSRATTLAFLHIFGIPKVVALVL